MKCIGKKRRFYIISVYIIGLLVWFLLIFFLKIYKTPPSLVLWITPIVFIISMANTKYIDDTVEKSMFSTSFFGTGLFIAIGILAWATKIGHHDKTILVVVLLAMTFTLLGHLEIWIPVKSQLIFKHVRTCFQTFAVVLYCYVLLSMIYHGVDNFISTNRRDS